MKLPGPIKEIYKPSDYARWFGIGTDAVLHHCRARKLSRGTGQYRLENDDATKFLRYLFAVCQQSSREHFEQHYPQCCKTDYQN